MDDNDNVKTTPEMEFDAGDFTMPRWKIGKDGSFQNTMTGEQKQILLTIPLVAKKSRWYWPEDYDPKNKPLCYSVNSVFPVEPVYAEVCAQCPMQIWEEDEEKPGKVRKPKCAKAYDYLLYDLESEQSAVLSLSRARMTTARAFNSFFKLNGVKFTVRFYTKIEQSASGIEFYQVKFEIYQKNEKPLMLEAAHMMLDNRDTPICGLIQQGVREEEASDATEPTSEEVPF
jgi:hypothetical protein